MSEAKKAGEASPNPARGPGASEERSERSERAPHGPPGSIDRSVIGQWGPELTMRVELGKIREFARAIKDDNPVFKGDEPLAPPTFLVTSMHWMEAGAAGGARAVKLDMRRVLHGEQEFEYVKPIRAGEVLTVRSRTKDVFEKEGSRGGKMLFMVSESEYRNRRGEVVAYSRSTTIQTEGTVKS
ncbi:MAG TPA: MaoC family dehydratase N-terminal domain-containing protein [Candidatus Binatus sp.]|nr:MaoC family dehydratase N-terminal domain-containing protein [Candidatus Binatus sp.]